MEQLDGVLWTCTLQVFVPFRERGTKLPRSALIRSASEIRSGPATRQGAPYLLRPSWNPCGTGPSSDNEDMRNVGIELTMPHPRRRIQPHCPIQKSMNRHMLHTRFILIASPWPRAVQLRKGNEFDFLLLVLCPLNVSGASQPRMCASTRSSLR